MGNQRSIITVTQKAKNGPTMYVERIYGGTKESKEAKKIVNMVNKQDCVVMSHEIRTEA